MKRARSDSEGNDAELQKRAKGAPTDSVSLNGAPATSDSKPPATEPAGDERAGNGLALKAGNATEPSSAQTAAVPAETTQVPEGLATGTTKDADASQETSQETASKASINTSEEQRKGETNPENPSEKGASESKQAHHSGAAEVTEENQTTSSTGRSPDSSAAKESAASADAAPTQEPAPKKPTTFSSFTSSSGFSGFSGSSSKFQSIAKSSGANPWAEPSKQAEKKPEDDRGKFRTTTPEESAAGFERQQDLVTGEEDEETEYSVKVRLYAVNLDSEEKSWKERGVGTLKLNSSRQDRAKKRLLMRAESVLRVSLNLPLVKNTQISKGFHSSLHTEKFLRISSIEDGHAYQFAVKLVSEEARDRLYDELENALSKI